MREINLPEEFKPNIGNRFVAGLIDYIIIFSFTFFMIIKFGEPTDDGGQSLNGILALTPIICWFIMTVGIEQIFGATVGNLLIGLKPISIQNSIESQSYREMGKLTISQSFKRHLLDIIDMSFFGLIAIITINNTEKKQRLGDLWANTIVKNI